MAYLAVPFSTPFQTLTHASRDRFSCYLTNEGAVLLWAHRGSFLHCRVEVFWEGCQAFELGRSCFCLQVLLDYFKQIPGLCVNNAFRQIGDKVRRNSKISMVRKLSFWQHNHYLTGSEWFGSPGASCAPWTEQALAASVLIWNACQ